MESELFRISTFAKWPSNAEADVYALARQGLYYSGKGDGVSCSACLVQLDGWKWSESPAEKHRRVSPRCRFVNNGTTSQMQSRQDYASKSSRGTLATDDGAAISTETDLSNQLVPESSATNFAELVS